MKFESSFLFILGCLFLIPSQFESADVCQGPFTQFLQCMGKDTDARIENYNKEITPAALTKVQQCFTQSGCPPPDFSQAQVSYFVQEPWTSRINAFLAILDNMDPKVQKCMTDYFKGILVSKINECVRKHGPRDIKDFQMPPIQGGYNVDMTKMKAVFLDRMMIRYQMNQCPALAGNPQAQAGIVGCIKGARQEVDDGGMCRSRENCVKDNIKDAKCTDRFNKIHQTTCACFNSENGKQEMQKEMKNTLLSGAVEKQLKYCYESNGLPYPKAKVDAAKAAAKAGFLDVLKSQGQVPPGVQGAFNVGKQVIGEMSEQWKGAFCAECADVNAATLQQMAANVQPQLAPSPLIAGNQFQPFQPQPAIFPQAGVPSAGAGAPQFVAPPPLPPQALANVNQPGPFQQPLAPQSSASAMSFEDFKQKLAQTFGPVG